MRQWQLEVRTKDGQPVDWHRIDWAKTNILEYDVIQPNGPKTVLGKVKFSFPSQHTVFMHDTRAEDKWMFNVARRTYSHGCMRVADPMGLAKIALQEDKGWTRRAGRRRAQPRAAQQRDRHRAQNPGAYDLLHRDRWR